MGSHEFVEESNNMNSGVMNVIKSNTLHATQLSTSESDCDVLIIGAGPVGLMIANYLGQQGVNVTLSKCALSQCRNIRMA